MSGESEAGRSASRTAEMVAAFRAAATSASNPWCNDPWAEALAGDVGRALAARWTPLFPHMQLWIALRTRFLDDAVRWAVRRGTDQIVLLGAGLDTRAARLATDGVRFFEVDHAGSQAEKRARVARLAGYPASAATYVTCDFQTDDFLDRLVANGFDAKAPALFVWEGVVYYLDERAVRATASRVAGGCHPESQLVFDYMGKRLVVREDLPDDERGMRDFVADLGEPLRFGLNDPLPLLFDAGFRHIRDVTFDQIAADVTNTYDRARMFRFQSVACASVAATGSPLG